LPVDDFAIEDHAASLRIESGRGAEEPDYRPNHQGRCPASGRRFAACAGWAARGSPSLAKGRMLTRQVRMSRLTLGNIDRPTRKASPPNPGLL